MGCRICTKDNLNEPIEIQSNDFEGYFDNSLTKDVSKRIETINKFKSVDRSSLDNILNNINPSKKEPFHKDSCESKEDELIESKEATDEQNSGEKKKLRSECTLTFFFSKTRSTKQVTLNPEMFYDTDSKEYNKRYFIGGPNSVMPNDFDLDDESICPKHLSIKYIPDEDSYVLSERKQSTGLFLKLKKRLVVDKNTIICFRNYHILISRENDNDAKSLANEETKHQLYVKLKIKFLSSDKKEDQVFSNREKSVVKIGRNKQCEIVLKDEHISRVHCRYGLVN